MRRDAKPKPPLAAVFAALHRRWGPQRWWPARTRFEMICGAILTQNTAWTNVERALANLRDARALFPAAQHALSLRELAALVRPAGTFRIKARRLRAFTTWLMKRHGGSLDVMFREDTDALRRDLLAVHGIGPETADCILLYAGRRPVFVVDAYTRRILHRHGWGADGDGYDAIAALFRDGIAAAYPPRRHAKIFNEYHALIVRAAKDHCRSRPVCAGCPLRDWLPAGGPLE